MTTEEALNRLSRVVGLRLESMLLETDRAGQLLSPRTYEKQKWTLRKRLEAVAGHPVVAEVAYTLWKNGESITVPPGTRGGLGGEYDASAG